MKNPLKKPFSVKLPFKYGILTIDLCYQNLQKYLILSFLHRAFPILPQIPKQSFADILQNRCSWKFLKFHRKRPVFESLLNKVAGLKACNFIKKWLQHSSFPVKFEKFLRTPFFTEHLRWLLLSTLSFSLVIPLTTIGWDSIFQNWIDIMKRIIW